MYDMLLNCKKILKIGVFLFCVKVAAKVAAKVATKVATLCDFDLINDIL